MNISLLTYIIENSIRNMKSLYFQTVFEKMEKINNGVRWGYVRIEKLLHAHFSPDLKFYFLNVYLMPLQNQLRVRRVFSEKIFGNRNKPFSFIGNVPVALFSFVISTEGEISSFIIFVMYERI